MTDVWELTNVSEILVAQVPADDLVECSTSVAFLVVSKVWKSCSYQIGQRLEDLRNRQDFATLRPIDGAVPRFYLCQAVRESSTTAVSIFDTSSLSTSRGTSRA
jgi:hypothetical protein